MRPALHIVAACTDRKRSSGHEPVRLRDIPAGPDRARRWVEALAAAQAKMPAQELYVGDHWSVVRSLPELAEKAGFDATLWVASAGYGLVRADQPVAAYSATFSSGHPDSVARGGGGTEALQAWWRSLSHAFEAGPGGRSFRNIASDTPDGRWLVVGSPAYIHAMEPQLADLPSVENRCLLVTGSPGPRDVRLLTSWLVSDAVLQPQLGGAMPALHARVARHLLQLLPDTATLTKEWAKGVLEGERLKSPGYTRPDRERGNDDEVKAFIRASLAKDDRASHTALLRAYRTAGRACEQSRFRALFVSVAGE